MSTIIRDRASLRGRMVSIGHGGWNIQSVRDGNQCTLSHYGNTWRGHLDDLEPDAVGVDLTVIEWEELCTLSISGPMCDPFLPAGMRTSWTDAPEPWIDSPQPERDARFGNARSLDSVALDVYLTIARRFGARIFNPRQD